jgi:hypothetical protein
MPHYTGAGLDWYELLRIRLYGIIATYFPATRGNQCPSTRLKKYSKIFVRERWS